MEAYPLYDYIQINKSSSVSTSADELNGIYTFNIPNGFYQSNQRSSVSTIEASIGRIRTVDDTVTPIHNINCCLVSPTPINANTVGNNAILPPTLFQVEVMMVLDGLGSNQNIVGNLLADFVITLKFVYYDPIKTTLGLGNQYTPTLI